MGKDFSGYSGSLPESQDDFHVAGENFLRLINFNVDSPTLLPRHKSVIEEKLVPFLVSATNFLGPGRYELNVLGEASATGGFQINAPLSDARALNSGNFAVSRFEAQASKNPHVSACKLVVNPRPLADTAALKDVEIRHISRQDIERKQAHFRAAQFLLSAGKIHRKNSEIFFIREIFAFKFKSEEEPLPVALESIKKVAEKISVIKFFANRIGRLKILIASFDAFMKRLEAALGPEGAVVIGMIKFMVPQEIQACYEIKNSENNHALYKYQSTRGNKFNFGVLDLLTLISESVATIKAVVDALKKASAIPKGFESGVQFLEKYVVDLHREAIELAKQVGPEFAQVVDIVFTMAEGGQLTKGMLAPSSGFVPFKWHDGTAKHLVTDPSGKNARRTPFGVLFNQVIDIEFGGAVRNSFRDFEAQAKIKSRTFDLLSTEPSNGFFKLLKANYGFPVIVGPTDLITD